MRPPPGARPSRQQIVEDQRTISAFVHAHEAERRAENAQRVSDNAQPTDVQHPVEQTPQPSEPRATGAVPAGPTPQQLAAQKAAQIAADKAAGLKRCLGEPITHMRTAQTNPFQVYVSEYDGLATEAAKCPSEPAAWAACIGMNARLWPDINAQSDESDLNRRYNAVMKYMPPGGTCLVDASVGESRSYCRTMSQDACLQKLKENVAAMSCSLMVMPLVWDAEIARNDAEAQQRHDDDCRVRWR